MIVRRGAHMLKHYSSATLHRVEVGSPRLVYDDVPLKEPWKYIKYRVIDELGPLRTTDNKDNGRCISTLAQCVKRARAIYSLSERESHGMSGNRRLAGGKIAECRLMRECDSLCE